MDRCTIRDGYPHSLPCGRERGHHGDCAPAPQRSAPLAVLTPDETDAAQRGAVDKAVANVNRYLAEGERRFEVPLGIEDQLRERLAASGWAVVDAVLLAPQSGRVALSVRKVQPIHLGTPVNLGKLVEVNMYTDPIRPASAATLPTEEPEPPAAGWRLWWSEADAAVWAVAADGSKGRLPGQALRAVDPEGESLVCNLCHEANPPLVGGRCAECRAEAVAS